MAHQQGVGAELYAKTGLFLSHHNPGSTTPNHDPNQGLHPSKRLLSDGLKPLKKFAHRFRMGSINKLTPMEAGLFFVPPAKWLETPNRSESSVSARETVFKPPTHSTFRLAVHLPKAWQAGYP
jgi:hypothetical protein